MNYTYTNYCNLYNEPNDIAVNYYKNRADLNLKFVTGGNKIKFKDAIEDKYASMNWLINEMTMMLTVDDLLGNALNEPDEETCKNDYIGMCHYRMFFDKMPELDGTVDLYVDMPYEMKFMSEIDYARKMLIISRCDIKKGYLTCHVQKYWNIFEEHFSKIYGKRFYDWSSQNSINAPCNMFIAKKQVFKDYMDWYKSHIYFFIQNFNRMDFNGDAYQERQLAFISERMFSLWTYLQKDRLNIKEIKATKLKHLGHTVDRK